VPSAFSHAIVALSLGSLLVRPKRLWLVGAACAVLPDADVIGFPLGVRYGDTLGHRGLSHSVTFAVLLALLVFAATRRFAPPADWATATSLETCSEVSRHGHAGVRREASYEDVVVGGGRVRDRARIAQPRAPLR
jgi:LexA-binding, inner membrane-associated putative hydrolase